MQSKLSEQCSDSHVLLLIHQWNIFPAASTHFHSLIMRLIVPWVSHHLCVTDQNLFVLKVSLCLTPHISYVIITDSVMYSDDKLCDINTELPYKVKTKYVQISNMIHTSVKLSISGKSTQMVKGCMDTFWYVRYCLQLLKSIDRLLFLQEFSKVKESSLHVIWNVHTSFLLVG